MKCLIHDRSMMYGRYSDKEMYRTAHKGSFFCKECVKAINTLRDMMSKKDQNEVGFWDRFHAIANRHEISREVQALIVTGLAN